MGALYKKIIHSADEVNERIDQMARDILDKYGSRKPLFVCLLHGGMPFAAKLMFAIAKLDPEFQPELDTMIISTYQDKRAGKTPHIVTDLSPRSKVKDRLVLIIDDVLDEGLTAAYTKKHLLAAGAEQADLIVLMEKDKARPLYPTAEMQGFKGPDVWLTGMGMDDAGVGIEGNRWMSAIAIANDRD